MNTPPITVLVCALGGEGGGVLAEWLYDAAVRAGYAAQSTSVPGVAQRTGATTYYVEVFPQPAAVLGGRRPVFSLNPVPGAIDLLVSSELLETLRQMGHGYSSPARTLVISSTARALTVAEKMQMTDGRADGAALVATLRAQCRAAELMDLAALAQQAGTAISAVLLGAIAGSGVLPMSRAVFEDTIRAAGKGVGPSLRGFALAFDELVRRRAQQQRVHDALSTEQAATTPPPPDLRALARQRLTDYQDAAYTALYDQRLARVAAAEQLADASGSRSQAITEEMTRWLALWMAFDDIVHVAALKLKTSRVARVRREVGAVDAEVVKTYDHFKPGVPEFAALLPATWAQCLLAWDRRRVVRGLDPWALPLRVGTHTVLGVLALRAVAALKGQRRRGSRYALEQQLIERWLAAVLRGTQEHWALGHELALCGRLIKGYGSTNERGKENLLHIIDHLAFAVDAGGAAQTATSRTAAVRAARQAATADDAGTALDQTLRAHGAPARPVREHTVRWFKRRPAG